MRRRRRRLVIADDHATLRRATVEWIERTGEFEVVADVGNATDALDAVSRLKPDVAVLDIDMPGRTPFAAASAMHKASPATRIIFLSGFSSDQYVAEALAAHATAYVTKSDSPDNLLAAIRGAVAGTTYFSPEVRERMIVDDHGVRMATDPPRAVRSDLLTPREREVLRHVAQGMSKRDIAALLKLSPRTIERHVANLMAKLGIHDRVGLTRYAIREGFVEA
ncbi:MAG: response regulator transcription factor [Phycisphaerae bacterium]|nr:response regulator transcription factor [Phycisphaerae bacterium]